MKGLRSEPLWQSITIVMLLIIGVFLAWPLAGMFIRSIHVTGEGVSLRGYAELFTLKYRILLNTLILGISVTVLSIILGGLLAYLVVRRRFWLSALVGIVPIIAFVVPDIIVAQSWMVVLGNNGIVTNWLQEYGIFLPSLYGWFGLIFVLVLQSYPYAYATLFVGLKGMDRSLEEAAQGLGEPPWRVVLRTTIPCLTPSVLAATLLVFTHVVNSFGIPAILGGKTPVLAVAIYNEFLSEMGSQPLMQSCMSTLLILTVIALLLFQKGYVERNDYRMEATRSAIPGKTGLRGEIAINAIAIAYIIFSAFPLLMVIVNSVSQANGPVITYGTFTLKNFERAFASAPNALPNSLLLASIATVTGTMFAIAAAFCIVKKPSWLTAWLDTMLMIPLSVAGIVLGIALAGTFNSGILVLTGSPTILVIAYFFRRMPFGVRSAAGALYSLKDSVEEAAVSLGMTPLGAFFKVIIPVMLPAVLSAAVLIWVTTLSELSATLVLYSGNWSTIPVQIYQQIDSDRMALASAHSVTLLGAIAVPLVIARLFGLKVFHAT